MIQSERFFTPMYCSSRQQPVSAGHLRRHHDDITKFEHLLGDPDYSSMPVSVYFALYRAYAYCAVTLTKWKERKEGKERNNETTKKHRLISAHQRR
jgi:hypothetical protein